MMKKLFAKTILALALVLSVNFIACSKKQNIKPTEANAVTNSDIESGRADSDSSNAMGLQTVHFPYDSAKLTPDNKEVLIGNEKVLKRNQSMKVQIEGHCDERGGIQYNLALGERRANAVRQYLTSHGIAKSRVSVISMGKEKPIDPGHDEEAWAKNRRGNFVITEK